MKNLKYNLALCAIGGLLIGGSIVYEGQKVRIVEIEKKQVELENENDEMNQILKHLETIEKINNIEEINIEILLETDIQYLQKKEKIILDRKIFYLSEEEWNIVLEKISQMKYLKSIKVLSEPLALDCDYEKPIPDDILQRLLDTISNLKEVEVLHLNHLSNLEEIMFLSKMKGLRELSLVQDNISDLTPLQNLKKLEKLYLFGNEEVTDIMPISTLTNLKELELRFTNVSNLYPLRFLVELEDLGLGLCDESLLLTEVESLGYLSNLKKLWIREFKQEDISFLSNLSTLENLRLTGGTFKDISVLINCPNLRYLSLENNEIDNIEVISNLSSLVYLDLHQNYISDITPLSSLINLEILDLEYNQIEDIETLKLLKKLKAIYLKNNQISNIHVLKELPNLHSARLLENRVSHDSLIDLLLYNENIEVRDCFSEDDLALYYEPIQAQRELKDVQKLELKHLLQYNAKYLKDYEEVYIDEAFFDLEQKNFNLVLKRLRELTSLKKLEIIGPSCYPNDNIGTIETKENIKKLTNTIKQIDSLEEITINSVYLLELEDISFVYNLPNLSSLDLSYNGIDDEELENIYETINQKKQIHYK